ncbi:MAG: hypothetical protein C0424_00960 [Sphingobacteriaceae bacterium]|nr:hypothetical protein [Sphingobacteriaceae bacterium]
MNKLLQSFFVVGMGSLFMNISTSAQSVQVGNNQFPTSYTNNNDYGPIRNMPTSAASGRWAYIYSASLLTGINNGAQISSLSFFRRSPGITMPANFPCNLKIYMRNSTANDFGAGNIDWVAGAATARKVFDGSPQPFLGSVDGFFTIPLDSLFTYTAGSSIEMYIQYTQSAAGSGILFGYDNDAAVPAFAPNSTKYVINAVDTFASANTALSNTRKPTIRFNFPAPINVGALSQSGQQFANIGDVIRPTARLTNTGLQVSNNITVTATAPGGYISTRQVATLARDSSTTVTFDSLSTTAAVTGQLTYLVSNPGDGYAVDDTLRVPYVVQNPNATPGTFDNGPLITHPGGGFGGRNLSRLNLPLTTLGSNINKGGFKILEDFTLPGTSNYSIDSMAFFGYQTGSPAFSSFTGLFVTIWDGHPAQGGELLYGDSTEFESVLEDTYFTGIYRASATTPLDSTRPIMKNIGKFFEPTRLRGGKKYFIQWSMTGSIASGPWQPAVSLNGMTNTGNAQQFTSTGYQFMDGGGGFPQAAPFEIYYRLNTTSVEETRLGLLESEVYPNPAKEEAFLYLNSEREQQMSYRIIDISGRELYRSESQWISGKTHLPLPIERLATGMYLIEVQGSAGNMHKKLQINK